MNKIHIAFSLMALLLIAAASPTRAQLLWEISGKKLKKPCYLYGTMHVSDPRVFNFSKPVMENFGKCDAFAGELVIDTNDPTMLLKLLPYMMMEGDTTLGMLLDEKEYELVKQKVVEKFSGAVSGADQQQMTAMFTMMIDRMKPMFTAIMLSEQEMTTKLQKSDKPPLDIYFQETAREKNMEVLGLETIDEQMDVFNTISLNEQARMLYKQLTDPKKPDGQSPVEEMIRLYAAQDIETLYKMATTDMSGNMNAKMLTERNVRMADRMEKIMKEKRIFVGVGAAHLPGEQGLIELLRKKGYKVKAVQ